MMILFCPWRTGIELCKPGQTWEDAFAESQDKLLLYHQSIIENMQKLHECKDSRDEHYAQWKIKLRGTSGSALHSSTTAESLGDESNDLDDLLDSLTDADRTRSWKKAQEMKDACDAVQAGELAGLYSVGVSTENNSLSSEHPVNQHHLVTSTEQEDEWRSAYTKRHIAFKESLRNAGTTTDSESTESNTNRRQQLSIKYLGDAHTNPNAGNIQVVAQKPSVEDTAPGLVDKLIAQFTLNAEQAHAFRLAAEHAMGNQEQLPLHMFIGGAGGTGKSRVIEALSCFFQIKNQTCQFHLASYTGIAARNISGMTLHTALNLGQLKTMIEKNGSRSRKELVESWEGIDYLFIDEVSMVGCSMLVDISMALGIAKESTAPFGGINVIFAGDFCQLPPVGDTPLYTAIESVTNKPSDSQTENSQKKIKGLTLWHEISVVILLSKSMRQSGQENERFRALLERLRFGICTDDDVRLLKSRLLSKAEVNLNQSCWRSAPIITRSNAVKDALNLRGIQCLADERHTTVNFYEAKDRHAGKKISRGPLRDYLLGLHSGRTKHTMGRLPLLPGMLVIIGHNYDVHGGVVNGSEGILKSVRYRIDEEGRCRATSCVVTVASASKDPLPHLPPRDVVVLEEDIHFTVPHPETSAQWSFVCKQLPVLPAFSFTNIRLKVKPCQISLLTYKVVHT